MVVRLANAPAPTAPVPVVNDVPVELVRRDVSSGLRHISRGERLPLPDRDTTDVIRMFVHWFGYDVDLGVMFTDAHFKHVIGYVDYTNLFRNTMRGFVTHSGDLTHAPQPDGACEFIDIKLHQKNNSALPWVGKKPDFMKKFPSARYAIMSLISYCGGPFKGIDNVAGVMTRSHGMAGQIFEPRTVETAAHVAVRSTSAIPLIVDLEQWELIWVDTSIGTHLGGYSTGQSDALKAVRAEMEAMENRLSVGELMRLWARAHSADTVNEPADQAQAGALLDAC